MYLGVGGDSNEGRIGRNPNTGAEALITPRRVVTFRPGRKLQGRVLGYANGIESHAPPRLPPASIDDERPNCLNETARTHPRVCTGFDARSAGDE